MGGATFSVCPAVWKLVAVKTQDNILQRTAETAVALDPIQDQLCIMLHESHDAAGPTKLTGEPQASFQALSYYNYNGRCKTELSMGG